MGIRRLFGRPGMSLGVMHSATNSFKDAHATTRATRSHEYHAILLFNADWIRWYDAHDVHHSSCNNDLTSAIGACTTSVVEKIDVSEQQREWKRVVQGTAREGD